MQHFWKLGIIFLAFGSLACVQKPILNESGSAVRLLTTAEPDCPEVGHVTTNNNWFREPNDVNVYLRNEAAKLDANIVLRDTLVLSEGNLYSGTGRVFRCEDDE